MSNSCCIFTIPRNRKRRNKGKKAEYIDIDWGKVIQKVRVDMDCSDAELASIQRACFAVGINSIIKNYNFIVTMSIPLGL